MLTESPAPSPEQPWRAVNARENTAPLWQGMLGPSVHLPNPAQAPAQGLSGALVPMRVLAQPPASAEVLPSAWRSRGWRCLEPGAEPGAGWGEQPRSEGGRGQLGRAQLRVFPAAFGCRWGLEEPSPASCQVWDILARVAGTAASLLPVHRGADIIPPPPAIGALRMSFSKIPGGSSIAFCPVCSLPTWGSPLCPGKVEQRRLSQARNLPWVLLASAVGGGVPEGEGFSKDYFASCKSTEE